MILPREDHELATHPTRSKPNFAPSVVQSLLAQQFESVSDLIPIVGGQESQIYRFRSGINSYVLRLNHAVVGFEKDAFANRAFNRPGLPIPEVIQIGAIEDSFYCISENISGVTLQELNAEALPAVLGPTAAALNAIAESNVNSITGFGPFNGSGVGRFGSWPDFLTSVGDRDFYDWPAVYSIVDRDTVNRLLEWLQKYAARCPEVRCLVHGDFGSNNVLTDGHRITGVIDWSESAVGDPLYDVANIFFWRDWLECMYQQARYFEGSLKLSPELPERLHCYQIRIGLAEMYENAISGNSGSLSWSTSRCRKLVR
jgi:hygromycin-B 4-O-kinase